MEMQQLYLPSSSWQIPFFPIGVTLHSTTAYIYTTLAYNNKTDNLYYIEVQQITS